MLTMMLMLLMMGMIMVMMMMMMMMMLMLMLMMMMMMMRGRWFCGCWGGGGGGKWWCWGGGCWGGRPISRPGSTLCASLRGRKVHGHFTRAILCGNLQGVPFAKPATPDLWEPAKSKCTWTCQKRHFVRKFTAKMPKRLGYHLDWTPGLNTYRKNPSVWTHCFGNKTNIIHHAEMQGNYISETLQKKDSQTSKYTAKMSSGSGNK